MSHLTLEMPMPRLAWPAWREHALACGAALTLHAGLAYVLLNLSHQAPMPVPISEVITTQLIALPAPVPPMPTPTPVAAQPPVPAPTPVAEPVVEAPRVEAPRVEAPRVEQADLAFKRVEQQRQEKAQKLERERQQRREAERDQARQALLEQQQMAQAREAEAARQAAATAAAAAAAALAEAQAAASRQYQPIAKQAPDYPARALERKIEGECTVAYTVNVAGRVEDPQVVGNCHPLFVKPSLAAAKSFRYQPRIVNGQAVAVANVKNTFSYKIQ